MKEEFVEEEPEERRARLKVITVCVIRILIHMVMIPINFRLLSK